MSSPIIQVEHLSKRYLVGHQTARRRRRYATLRDVVAREAINFARKAADFARGRQIIQGDEIEEFWALKDVSFDIRQGEVVGIIGSNGAGKSTLLKILSQITDPSEGRVTLRGRVASMLEVGTGFHPELTGRENIFLNGVILGMTRAEVRSKFDEIVAFAEVEKFLDTPVKHFSSGMYVRLAFAVAAHLEPEILAVDEVLAVGDAAFQKKCLGKMGDVARGGRTVLFVSHNMHAIEKLCQRVICLRKGRLAGIYDDVREGVLAYFNEGGEGGARNVWTNRDGEIDNDYFVPEQLEVASLSPDARPGLPFPNDHPIAITLTGDIRQEDPALNIGVSVHTEDGEQLFWSFTGDPDESQWPRLAKGKVRLRAQIPAHFLNEGGYRVQLAADIRNRRWLHDPNFGGNPAFVTFSIRGGLSPSAAWTRRRPGNVAPVLVWEAF